jgi:uncharacterized protein YndB with AHSA1/START domain
VSRRVTLTRTLRATADEVWSMWTTTEGLESWWGPDGFRVEVRSLDLRPGGLLRYAMIAVEADKIAFVRANGMPTTSETTIRYVDIDAPRRLAYVNLVDFVPDQPTYEVATVMELSPVGDATQLELTFDAMHAPEWTARMTAGWEQELDRLVARLDRRTP